MKVGIIYEEFAEWAKKQGWLEVEIKYNALDFEVTYLKDDLSEVKIKFNSDKKFVKVVFNWKLGDRKLIL